jgi:redox-sensitive bicupin YhaK (pirin superfamily)
MNFGVLRVLNDDIVTGGAGFDTHPHDNMEIISIPLQGSMVHKDSTGREMVIREGDVQIMSAGTGLYHSEYNHSGSDDLNFLQIWVIPKKRNINPRYDQRAFPLKDRMNKLKMVISPDQEETLWINQDAYFTLGHYDHDQNFSYTIKKEGNGIYLFVIGGNVKVANEELQRRDGIGLTETTSVEIKAAADSRFLIIEIPMS